MADELSIQITKEDNTWLNIGLTLYNSLVELLSSHNGFPLNLDDHKNKWSHHRSFLYGCNRSPVMHVLKLGTEIPNLKQNDWSTWMV